MNGPRKITLWRWRWCRPAGAQDGFSLVMVLWITTVLAIEVSLLHVSVRDASSLAKNQPIFPNARGGRLSSHGVHYLLNKHVTAAAEKCPSLKNKRVSPHVLRHTTAMDLLQQGTDRSVIALWLGHESLETTQIYLDADLEMKQRVLDRVIPLNGKPGRYRPDDKLLAFLKNL